MKGILTILGALLIPLTTFAGTDSKSCIEALNGKKVSFQFSGGDLWDKLSGLNTVSLSFDSGIRGGMVAYSNNYGLNTELKIYPLAKSLEHSRSIRRADQESGEQNIQVLNCVNEKEKKSCESSVGRYFREVAAARSAARVFSDEIDQAIACMVESLNETVH